MNKELKPCPFCGKQPIEGPLVDEGIIGFFQCSNRSCVANQEEQGGVTLEIWNRRVMPECVRVVLDSYEFGNGGNATSDAVREYYGELDE